MRVENKVRCGDSESLRGSRTAKLNKEMEGGQVGEGRRWHGRSADVWRADE